MLPVVSASDDNYIHHFAAMLHSLCLFHPDVPVYLLDSGISDANLGRLKAFCNNSAIALTILPCLKPLQERLWSDRMVAPYARLLIPELFDRRIERCLYIDADTTIVAPLNDLFNLDMRDFPIATIRDSGDENITRRESELHGIDFGNGYFNTGVMMMDLKKWRSEDIAGRSFAYARAHPDRMLLWDQSCLNALLYRQNRPIDAIWNFFKLKDARKLSGPPHIIHYTTLPKPTEWPESPFADLYKFHRDQTPWPFAKLPPTKRNRFRETRTVLGAALGIGKYSRRQEDEQLLDFIRTEIGSPALSRARKLSTNRSVR